MLRKALMIASMALVVGSAAMAQTYTGVVGTEGSSDDFLFSLSDSAQAHFTVSWSDSGDDMGLILTCAQGPSTLTFGVSVPEDDRFASLDVGVLGDLVCLLGVALFDGANGTYRVNMRVGEPSDFAKDRGLAFRPVAEADLADAKVLSLLDANQKKVDALRANFTKPSER